MKIKQRLHQGDRHSDPNIRALDATEFTYHGWEEDKKQAERRLTGDCILLHMGSIGFQDTFCKMQKKQALHMDRSSIACLRDLDALGGPAGSAEPQPPPRSNERSAQHGSMTATIPTTPSPSTPTPQTEPPLVVQRPKETSAAQAMADNKCVVCLDKQVTHAYIPCGHLCVCRDCVANYDAANDSCPLCRERSYCVTKIYC